MTSTCYFINDLCFQDLNRASKRTKCWLDTREYKIDKFLSQKGSIKFKVPNVQNSKGDYYNNIMMQFKQYLSSKLCCYESFICMTSSKFRTTSMSISWPF